MPQIDATLQRLATYPATCAITARVGDLDGYRHLNGVRIGQYYEEARAAFYGHAFDAAHKPRLLVADLTLQYLREAFWPGVLEVGTGIALIGQSSFHMTQALFQEGHCVGLCRTVLVHAPVKGATPLPGGVLDALTRWRLRPDRVAAAPSLPLESARATCAADRGIRPPIRRPPSPRQKPIA